MKQKTAIRQLIDKLERRIKAYADFNNGEKDVSSILALQEAQELESVNEQQIKDAYAGILDHDKFAVRKALLEKGQQYFNETFEKP